jgi:hypothetical protein
VSPLGCSAPSEDGATVGADESSLEEASDGLFSSTSDFAFALDAPFNQLITRYRSGEADPPKDDRDDDDKHDSDRPPRPKFSEPGHVVFGGRTFDVRVAIRGNTSPRDCAFPKYSVQFTNKTQTKDTPFQGNKKFRVNSHCGDGGPEDRGGRFGRIQNEISPIREELVYRLVRAAGAPTYRTRLAKISYKDTSAVSPIAPTARYGLMIESGDVAAKRLVDAHLIDKDGIYINDDYGEPENAGADASKIDDDNIADVYLAEVLVSNSDWKFSLGSPGRFWNIDVFGEPHKATQYAFLQDFDLASAVNGQWGPEEVVPSQIKKFRKAFDSKPHVAKKAAARFREKKAAVYAELAAVEREGSAAGRLPSTDHVTTTDPGFQNARKALDLFFALPELQ